MSVLGKSLAVEWAGFGRANSVSPGYVESGLTGSAPDDVKEPLKEKTPMRFVPCALNRFYFGSIEWTHFHALEIG